MRLFQEKFLVYARVLPNVLSNIFDNATIESVSKLRLQTVNREFVPIGGVKLHETGEVILFSLVAFMSNGP